MLGKIFLFICLILSIALLSFGVFTIGPEMEVNKVSEQNTITVLVENKLQIIEATFNTPNIIIPVENISSIVDQAKINNQTSVFKVNEYGYVVLDNQGIYAWNYNPTIQGYSIVAIVMGFVATMFSALFLYVAFQPDPPSHYPYGGPSI